MKEWRPIYALSNADRLELAGKRVGQVGADQLEGSAMKSAITAMHCRQWHWNTMHPTVEGYPWISYANNGMSYGMSEDRQRYALIDGIDWAGHSPVTTVLAESEDFESIRDAFWAEQYNRRGLCRI